MRKFLLALFVCVFALPVAAAELPDPLKASITIYTKAHLIDDFLHCASYNKIAAECTAGDAKLSRQYANDSSVVVESAIKLAISAGVTPDQFRPKIAEIDSQMRAQSQGNCQSVALAQQYAFMCRDLVADAGPRTIYWADQFQAARRAAGKPE